MGGRIPGFPICVRIGRPPVLASSEDANIERLKLYTTAVELVAQKKSWDCAGTPVHLQCCCDAALGMAGPGLAPKLAAHLRRVGDILVTIPMGSFAVVRGGYAEYPELRRRQNGSQNTTLTKPRSMWHMYGGIRNAFANGSRVSTALMRHQATLRRGTEMPNAGSYTHRTGYDCPVHGSLAASISEQYPGQVPLISGFASSKTSSRLIA